MQQSERKSDKDFIPKEIELLDLEIKKCERPSKRNPEVMVVESNLRAHHADCKKRKSELQGILASRKFS